MFDYGFYPTGALHSFKRAAFETKDHRIDYYNSEGEKVGVMAVSGGRKPAEYEWKGQNIDRTTFLRRAAALLEDAPEQAEAN
jgi:hypothetical protein